MGWLRDEGRATGGEGIGLAWIPTMAGSYIHGMQVKRLASEQVQTTPLPVHRSPNEQGVPATHGFQMPFSHKTTTAPSTQTTP
jgi:hypothetical protein